MKIQNRFIVIFVSVVLLTSISGYGVQQPKTAAQLIAKYQDAWNTATIHPSSFGAWVTKMIGRVISIHLTRQRFGAARTPTAQG